MNVLALVLLISIEPSASPLSARFIGNSAFELSDGRAAILLDFPYESGAFGYMAFPKEELHRRENSLCLFTHRHADHFDASAVASVGCSVAGPDEVQSAVPATHRAGPGPVWSFRGATIRCLSTRHADVEHCSYVINWHDHQIFVSGDIEDLKPLTEAPERVGTVLLPSWLASEVQQSLGPSASQVIIHHHTEEETIPVCPNCILPIQGTTFKIGGATPNPCEAPGCQGQTAPRGGDGSQGVDRCET